VEDDEDDDYDEDDSDGYSVRFDDYNNDGSRALGGLRHGVIDHMHSAMSRNSQREHTAELFSTKPYVQEKPIEIARRVVEIQKTVPVEDWLEAVFEKKRREQCDAEYYRKCNASLALALDPKGLAEELVASLGQICTEMFAAQVHIMKPDHIVQRVVISKGGHAIITITLSRNFMHVYTPISSREHPYDSIEDFRRRIEELSNQLVDYLLNPDSTQLINDIAENAQQRAFSGDEDDAKESDLRSSEASDPTGCPPDFRNDHLQHYRQLQNNYTTTNEQSRRLIEIFETLAAREREKLVLRTRTQRLLMERNHELESGVVGLPSSPLTHRDSSATVAVSSSSAASSSSSHSSSGR
jgi:hypothetical protein